MATNIINVNNLPEVQELFDGNYIIVQTDTGTKIIDWQYFGALKLDTNGNGSFSGNLSGNGLDVSSATITTLTVDSITVNGNVGASKAGDYYNKFITTNGLVTSATYVTGSPEYVEIIETRIPAITAALLSAYQANYTDYINFTWSGSGTTETVNFPNQIPTGLTINDFFQTDFTFAQTNNLSTPLLTAVPTFNNITTNGGALEVTVNTAQANLDGITFQLKVSKFYQTI